MLTERATRRAALCMWAIQRASNCTSGGIDKRILAHSERASSYLRSDSTKDGTIPNVPPQSEVSLMSATESISPPNRGWNIALWIAQVMLFIMFMGPGIMKTFMDPAALSAMGLLWPSQVPIGLVRFIGIMELAGSLGIILPAATRVYPVLTPLAALGFVTIQILAIGFHTVRGEIATAWPFNAVYLPVALFVLWGRTRKVPITSRPETASNLAANG